MTRSALCRAAHSAVPCCALCSTVLRTLLYRAAHSAVPCCALCCTVLRTLLYRAAHSAVPCFALCCTVLRTLLYRASHSAVPCFARGPACTMPMLSLAGRALEYRTIPGATDRPTLVFLHEGLGSAHLWRDFPD